jgi:hypothetical protein
MRIPIDKNPLGWRGYCGSRHRCWRRRREWANGVGGPGLPCATGGSVTAIANSPIDFSNLAIATGGNGGNAGDSVVLTLEAAAMEAGPPPLQ